MKEAKLIEVFQSTEKSLTAFVKGLKTISDELPELEFEEYLEEEVLPVLIKDNVVCNDSIWSKMDVVKTVRIDSILEDRGLSLEESIFKMNADAICWIFSHIYNIEELLKLCPSTTQDQKWHVTALENNVKKLKEWINNDMFERIQNYESEIKELRKVIEYRAA